MRPLSAAAGALAACSLSLALACTSARPPSAPPARAPLRYAFSEAARAACEEDPSLRAELEGVLTELFGTPDAPRFAPSAALRERDVDPAASPFAGRGAADGFGPAELDELRADNRARWARELGAIERDEPPPAAVFAGRERLGGRWSALLAERDALEPGDFRRRARALFEHDYPTLADAARHFRAGCARCHGASGDGAGPMARRLAPRPRDYRRGMFKFTSVCAPSRPRRADLLRTLEHGLPGSAMPSFARAPLADRHGLIDYVRLLSMRGEAEALLVAHWRDDGERPAEVAGELYDTLWERWLTAQEHFLAVDDEVPAATPASVALGDRLFHDPTKGNCASCHGPEGRGDGPAAVGYDERGERVALLRDEWGNYILPRDLTSGVFRGGARPVDLFRRAYCGIRGTPMPSVGTAKAADGGPLLTRAELWALVHYVRSLAGLE